MSNPALPTELYTTKTLFTLSGSSASVWLLTKILERVFEVDVDHSYRWIALLVAVLVSFIGAMQLGKINLQLGTVAFFNGLLIFVTASGLDSINEGSGKNISNVDEKGAAKNAQTSHAALIPFLAGNPWWPSTALSDSIKFYRKENARINALAGDLEIKNKALNDSVVALGKPSPAVVTSPTANTDMAKCFKKNQALQAEIVRISKELETALTKLNEKKPGEKEIPNNLSSLKSLNQGLLKSLNEYINAGEMNPKGQIIALRTTNEKVIILRKQLETYNNRIDELLK